MPILLHAKLSVNNLDRELAELFAGRETMIRDMQARLLQVAATANADWQRAMDLRITTVPAHLCGGKRLTGFAAYEDFVSLFGKSR